MAKSNKDDLIAFSLTYNEDFTCCGLVIESDSPISEAAFLTYIYDFYINNEDLDWTASGEKNLAAGGMIN